MGGLEDGVRGESTKSILRSGSRPRYRQRWRGLRRGQASPWAETPAPKRVRTRHLQRLNYRLPVPVNVSDSEEGCFGRSECRSHGSIMQGGRDRAEEHSVPRFENRVGAVIGDGCGIAGGARAGGDHAAVERLGLHPARGL